MHASGAGIFLSEPQLDEAKRFVPGERTGVRSAKGRKRCKGRKP
jgi:hypothetical protein